MLKSKKRKINITEKQLKLILGGTYGGPSIGFDGTKFIIYIWFDAPVGNEILAKGDTIKELILNYNKKWKKLKIKFI